MRRMLCLVAIILVTVPAALPQSKAGTSVAQFLLVEPSARIAGMGNAGATMYGEIEAAYYNPAAIGLSGGNGVQFTHSLWIADITYDYAGVVVTLGEFGNIFADVTALNSGEIDVRTVDQPLGTGERYTVSDLAFGLGYGRQISDRFSVGIQATYFQETIWHSSLSAFALNVGTLYRISDNGLRIGASISNFGTRASFDGYDLRVLYDQNAAAHGDNGTLPATLVTETFPLPIIFRVGIGMPIVLADDHVVQVAVDAFHPSDNSESMSMGVEYGFSNTIFFRGGYQNLFEQDAEVGLTLGAGIRYHTDGYVVTVDYGWADQGRLQKSHRMTLGVSF
jgi:hypothetical protein